MELAPPRGTQDLLPRAATRCSACTTRRTELARLFGYRYVETPTFEDTELFVAHVGRDLRRRHEGDVHVRGQGRAVGDAAAREHRGASCAPTCTNARSLPNPFKAYYVDSEFRHGRPQAGRMREFRQFGIEVIGAAAPGADVEVIALGDRFLRERGLRDIALQLNSIGDATCRPAYRERLVAYFEPFRDQLDEDCRAGSDATRCASSTARSTATRTSCGPRRRSPITSASRARRTSRRCAPGSTTPGSRYELDPRLVRGLDYYTRTAFEWISGALSSEGQRGEHAHRERRRTLRRSGRGARGAPTPGVGFAMGLDRVAARDGRRGRPAARRPHAAVLRRRDRRCRGRRGASAGRRPARGGRAGRPRVRGAAR